MIKEKIITMIVFSMLLLFIGSVTYGEQQAKKQMTKEEKAVEAKRVYCLKKSGFSSPYCWTPKDWDAYCSKVTCQAAKQ